MRQRIEAATQAGPAPVADVPTGVAAALRAAYQPRRARVDVAAARLRTVNARMHRPDEARTRAGELTAALREASGFVARALGRLGPDAQPWGAELVRLAELGVWLRRTTMDDLGVGVPAAVRVGSRAASGPHVAGLEADPPDLVAATLHQPWIGVSLRDVVDGGDPEAA